GLPLALTFCSYKFKALPNSPITNPAIMIKVSVCPVAFMKNNPTVSNLSEVTLPASFFAILVFTMIFLFSFHVVCLMIRRNFTLPELSLARVQATIASPRFPSHRQAICRARWPTLLLDSRPARQRLWDGKMLLFRISFLLRCEVIHAEPSLLVCPGSLGLPSRCRSEFVKSFYPVFI
ncbi:MAG: hypothetical protein JWO45_2212, partial [Spartobacteria bacterium]|nr:hypothetical protein [Spartobacteria bacterium]